MVSINKRPIVIQDLIEQATYIADNNLDVAEQFLTAAEATFQRIGTMPGIGKLSGFTHPQLVDIRQYPVAGYKNYLIFYRIQSEIVEIIRVLHGARDVEPILEKEITP